MRKYFYHEWTIATYASFAKIILRMRKYIYREWAIALTRPLQVKILIIELYSVSIWLHYELVIKYYKLFFFFLVKLIFENQKKK